MMMKLRRASARVPGGGRINVIERGNGKPEIEGGRGKLK
jgi:hypothetical protein